MMTPQNQTKTKPQVWQRDVSGVAGGDDVQPPVALHRGVAHEPAAVVLRVGEDLAEAASAFGFRLQQEGRGAAGAGVAKGKDLGVAGSQQGFWNNGQAKDRLIWYLKRFWGVACDTWKNKNYPEVSSTWKS